jgi:hypothetical protein
MELCRMEYETIAFVTEDMENTGSSCFFVDNHKVSKKKHLKFAF